MFFECKISDKHGNLIRIVTPQEQVELSTKKLFGMFPEHSRKMVKDLVVAEIDSYQLGYLPSENKRTLNSI